MQAKKAYCEKILLKCVGSTSILGTKDSVETADIFISAYLSKSGYVKSGKPYEVQITFVSFAEGQSQVLQLQVHVPNPFEPISYNGGQVLPKAFSTFHFFLFSNDVFGF